MQKYQGVLSSIGRRDMYYSSLDSSRQGASNGRRIMSLAPLDDKLFAFNFFKFIENNSLSIDPKDMIRLPLDTYHQGKFNKLHFIVIWSQNDKIMQFKAFKKKLSDNFWYPTVQYVYSILYNGGLHKMHDWD